MPIMLSPDASPIQAPGKQSFAHQRYGHQIRVASKCGHEIHPSASEHTPWCPACTASLGRAKLDVANKKLVAEGGLHPPEHKRNRRWNLARKGYDNAKQRVERARKMDQLRWEREQAWDDTHQLYNSPPSQAAVLSQYPSLCPACDSMMASYPTSMPEVPVAGYLAWWEQPGALATKHILVPSTPPRPRNQKRKRAQSTEGDLGLRELVQGLRKDMRKMDAHREAWERRWQAEAAVRRKHGLGADFEFQSEFWDAPMPAVVSRRQHQHNKAEARMAERRARGNRGRPKPPRSSLSYSETSEEVQVDQSWWETQAQKKAREAREQEAQAVEQEIQRVAEEVGYLYFVGVEEGMERWKEDV
ncbi:hypothetical protein BDW02DRAFT_567856, partial [Decorospora gaudefroyi]